jgi:outer membrane biosynthesis protein TonB
MHANAAPTPVKPVALTARIDSATESLEKGVAPSGEGISSPLPPEPSPKHSSATPADTSFGVEDEPKVETSVQRGFGPAEGDSSPFGMVNLLDPKSSVGNSNHPLKVRIGAVETRGGLDKNVVQRILRQGNGAFRNCYENVLMQSSKAEGTVTLTFEIDERGSVSQSTVLKSDFTDPVMTPCIVSVISSLAFPKPSMGLVTVVLPIQFSK